MIFMEVIIVKKINLKSLIYVMIFMIVISLMVELYIVVFDVPSYILPRPSKIILNIPNMIRLHKYDFYITIIESWIGLLIAIVTALLFTYLMDKFKIINTLLYPVLFIMQSVPVLLLAPMLMIVFGFGLTPKIILVAIMGFFPLLVSLNQGIKSIDENYVKFLEINKATKNQIFYHVKLKGAMSSFFAGLKLIVAYAYIGAIFAETMGGINGIGLVIARYQKSLKATNIFTIIILIMLISLISYAVIIFIEKKSLKYKGE